MRPQDAYSLVGSSILPKARDSEIVVQEVGDELLVYNLVDDKAHHLNKSLALVWRSCDGEKTVAEVSKQLSDNLGLKIDPDFVWLALSELEKVKLLEDIEDSIIVPDVSRRKVLFKYAVGSLALPVVVSLVAPISVSAQSCAPRLQPVGGPCIGPPDCCPGLICGPAIFVAPGTCQLPPPPP